MIKEEEAIEQLKLMKVFIGYDAESPLVKKMQSALDMGIKALEQTIWIPVSERSPKKNGNYLVTVEANDETASIKYQTVDHFGPKWLHDEKTRKVIAWRPLSETYAESEVKENGRSRISD